MPDSNSKTLVQHQNVEGIDEVQGEWELDELVDDLRKDWSRHEGKNDGVQKATSFPTEGCEIKEDATVCLELQNQTALQPVTHDESAAAAIQVDNNFNQQRDVLHKQDGTVPWSLDWLASKPQSLAGKGSQINGTAALPEFHMGLSTSNPSNKLKSGHVKRSVGFIKRVAHMQDNDRKEIIKILRKHETITKARKWKKKSNAAGTSTSDSSKNSISSVNNDRENWVMLHGKSKVVAEDVRDTSKKVGIKFQCNTSNSFNLLTKEGRREWRASGGGELVREGVDGEGGGVDGC